MFLEFLKLGRVRAKLLVTAPRAHGVTSTRLFMLSRVKAKAQMVKVTNDSSRSHSIKKWPHGRAPTTSQYLSFCYSRFKQYLSSSTGVPMAPRVMSPRRIAPAFLLVSFAFSGVSSGVSWAAPGSQGSGQQSGQITARQEPVLHHRSEADTLEEGQFFTVSRGTTTLPVEASGEYSLGETGELVEIDLEPNQLTGYISRLGDAMSDAGTPLTFFFETSWLNGRRIGFTTRRVHGTWFTFDGTIVRGNAESRYQDGYYRLQGTMVMHSADGSAEPRNVSLPMTAQYSGQ
jgi:hypothetical protein